MKSLRHLILILLFACLVSIEIGHGVFRIESLRRKQRDEALESLRLGQRELARGFEESLRAGRDHARYLARMPGVRALLRALPGGAGESEARARLERDLSPYLLAFPVIDRLAVLDAAGAERFRMVRLVRRQDGGVGSLPAALLDRGGEGGGRAPAPAGLAEPALSGIEIERDRLDVPENNRQVLRYAAPVAGEGGARGVLVLTLYAAPLLDAVRSWTPRPGVVSALVDAGGRFLAHPDRTRDRPAGASLPEEFPRAARAILDGQGEAREGEVLLLAAPVAEGLPGWRLVARVPDGALESSALSIRGEYGWVLGSVAATAFLTVIAGYFLLRLSIREVRLAESNRYLTREKEMERQLRISERLGSLGLLTAGVAHEINNPLEGIENYLTLLDREGGDPAKRSRYLEMLRYGFRRIRDLVRDLSSFARPEVKGARADLVQVVERALSLVQYDRAFRGVEVERKGLDRPIQVAGDPGRLEQVFLNLLVNAARALAGRGRVTISARPAPPLAGSAEPMVETVVEDTGPGIPEEALGRIFDPFFTTGEGSGLGLSISYGIVRAHGGEIRAGNRPEGGARFTVLLPAAEARGPEASPEAGGRESPAVSAAGGHRGSGR